MTIRFEISDEEYRELIKRIGKTDIQSYCRKAIGLNPIFDLETARNIIKNKFKIGDIFTFNDIVNLMFTDKTLIPDKMRLITYSRKFKIFCEEGLIEDLGKRKNREKIYRRVS